MLCLFFTPTGSALNILDSATHMDKINLIFIDENIYETYVLVHTYILGFGLEESKHKMFT